MARFLFFLFTPLYGLYQGDASVNTYWYNSDNCSLQNRNRRIDRRNPSIDLFETYIANDSSFLFDNVSSADYG